MIRKILFLIYFLQLTFYMSISVDCKNTDVIRQAKNIYYSQNTHPERNIFNTLDIVSKGNIYAQIYHTTHTQYSMSMFVY